MSNCLTSNNVTATTKQRIIWVDIVKYICIMFVMIHHMRIDTNILSVFYPPFFLMGFFFVAGYVYKNKDNFKTFFYKKVRGLFIPWLVFSLILIFWASVFTLHPEKHPSLLFDIMKMFIQIRWEYSLLWFLCAIFIVFIPFYFFIKSYEKQKNNTYKITAKYIFFAFLLSLISVIYTKTMNPDFFPWHSVRLPWHLDYIFQAMFFMFLGYLFKGNIEKIFDKYNTLINKIIIIISYLLIIYIPYFLKLKFSIPIDILYFYIKQLLGVTMLVSICKSLKTNRYINYVGQNTLIYYVFHIKFLSTIEFLLGKYVSIYSNAILQNTLYSSIFSIIFAFVLSIILIIPAWIINKYFPFILGRPFKKQKIKELYNE